MNKALLEFRMAQVTTKVWPHEVKAQFESWPWKPLPNFRKHDQWGDYNEGWSQWQFERAISDEMARFVIEWLLPMLNGAATWDDQQMKDAIWIIQKLWDQEQVFSLGKFLVTSINHGILPKLTYEGQQIGFLHMMRHDIVLRADYFGYDVQS